MIAETFFGPGRMCQSTDCWRSGGSQLYEWFVLHMWTIHVKRKRRGGRKSQGERKSKGKREKVKSKREPEKERKEGDRERKRVAEPARASEWNKLNACILSTLETSTSQDTHECGEHQKELKKYDWRPIYLRQTSQGRSHCIRHTATQYCVWIHCTTLQHTATHCNTLQHTATHCNTLQCTATQNNTLQHVAMKCNTLQHAATHRTQSMT